VRAIEKRNTARIIPNALEISVARDDDKETKVAAPSPSVLLPTADDVSTHARTHR
jgi:hypothetical protein